LKSLIIRETKTEERGGRIVERKKREIEIEEKEGGRGRYDLETRAEEKE
jgi:hypothetical protein